MSLFVLLYPQRITGKVFQMLCTWEPRLLFLGPPLAGKGTQCEMLSKQLNIPHISSGDLLRQEISANTEMSKHIKETLALGQLIEDKVIIKIINKRMETIKGGFILDGYPRTLEQFNQIKFKYDKIIVINTPLEILMKRVEGRLCHIPSGRTYHKVYNPPKKEGYDDVTGDPLTKREDDRIELVQHRVLDYLEKTGEVLKRGTLLGKVFIVNGSRSKQEINKDILSIIISDAKEKGITLKF